MITIRQLMWVSLALCASSRTSANAQSLTITGRVVDSNEQPIVRAIVYLNPSKVAALTRSDGRYEMVVPDSIVHSQTVPLVVFKGGREMKTVMVVLEGHSIVHDFTLPLDTLRKKKYGTALSPDLLMHSPGYALTISGRTLNREGNAVDGVMVSVDSLNVGGQSDSLGNYSILIRQPRGQRATIQARLMGFAKVTDTLTLVGTAIHRDFAMLEPFYAVSTSAAAVLKWKRGIDLAAGLTDLAIGPHMPGDREIRIWMLGGVVHPYFFRLLNRKGKVTGEIIFANPPNGGNEPEHANPRGGLPLKSCTNSPSDVGTICKARFKKAPSWTALWQSLDSLDVWHIADEGTLGLRASIVLDGEWTVAELWNGESYRAWAYHPGVHDSLPGRARVTEIAKLLYDIDSQSTP
ncbi:MAG: carboxypeptidase regulatory-like domain-containing protein [Gemmatimonadaceae bacterium]